jgi:beta-lactamase superfamily II metal-dependent hydrolase
MHNRRLKEKTMRAIKALLTITLLVCPVYGQSRNGRALDIYVVDVEGGNAVLFVTPAGESVLIDSGNAGAAAVRDADRIMAAVRDAGIKQIDHLITTHYHGDHVGGLPELAKRIPVLDFIDHGPNVQPSPNVDPVLAQYAEIHGKVKHTIAKPGDRVQLTGVDWRIVTAGGAAIKTAMPGAGRPNTACTDFKTQDPDATENAQSVGSVISFGSFRVVHLGDLTWNKEFDLMCPNNRIGTADLFIVSHHGQASSNSPVLVHGVRPRVAIMNNGTRKGGQPDAMKVLFSSPGLEDLWQIHFSLLSGQEYTVPGAFIANIYDEQPVAMPVTPMSTPPQGQQAPPPPQHNGAAYYFKVSARPDGTFTVTNTRNGFSKTYNKERS